LEETWELAALDMTSRPAIPASIRREVEQEAGYRCAIPTCRDKGPFDFEHIDEWSKVKKHEFHNIILLCVSCHARVTRKGTSAAPISKDALRKYKRNLAIISGRYSLYEMRLLELFYGKATLDEEGIIRTPSELTFFVNTTDKIHVAGLLKDGFIEIYPMFTESFSKAERVADYLLSKDTKSEGLVIEKKLGSKIINITKERLVEYITGMDGSPTGFISLTKQGFDFLNKYFSGEEIQ